MSIYYLTKRLELRPYSPEDYELWKQAHLSASPSKNKYDPGRKSEEELKKDVFLRKLERLEMQREKDRLYKYGAFQRDGAALIGELDFFIICREHYQVGNIGYYVFNHHWGQGYGKEIASGGLRIGFEELKLHRIEAAVREDNPTSESVAVSAGMEFESVKRAYIKFEDGWKDMKVYVALGEEPPPST